MSIVKIERSLSVLICIGVDLELHIVVDAGEDRGAVIVHQYGKHRATSDEDSLLEVGKGIRHPLTLGSGANSCLAVVVVPRFLLWKGIGDLLHVHVLVDSRRSGDFRSDKDRGAKHELRCNVSEAGLIGELAPHWAHKRLSCLSCGLCSAVNVVNQVVSAINRISDGLADTASLHPRLTVLKREGERHILRVSTEEGIPHTDLVKHDEKVVCWGAVEAWNVGTSERMACIAQLHDHGDRALEFLEDGAIVTSPVVSKLLGTKEEASCEDERSLRILVSLEKASVGRALMESTIGIVHLVVAQFCAISLDVDGIHGHGMSVCAEDSWLVHVIPETVHVVASFEDIVVEKAAPVVLSIGVQKVNPDGVTGPAVSFERLGAVGSFSNENVGYVLGRLLLIL
jgi:hypothetical protein